MYVVAYLDDSVTAFARDPETGDLTPAGCVSATGSDGQTYTFTNQITGDKAFEVIDMTTAGGAAPTGSAAPATTSG